MKHGELQLQMQSHLRMAREAASMIVHAERRMSALSHIARELLKAHGPTEIRAQAGAEISFVIALECEFPGLTIKHSGRPEDPAP